jgi:hypothetical protein
MAEGGIKHDSPAELERILRVDTDVLAWFKAQGRGHLTRMNAVLRAYMEAHTRRPLAGALPVPTGND